jgi:hypothetical protein
VLGGGAFHFEGLEERIFSSTAVRRQIRAGEKSRSIVRACQGAMSQRKKAEEPVTRRLGKSRKQFNCLGWHGPVATNKMSKG